MRTSTIIAAAAAVALGGATVGTSTASAMPLGASTALAQQGAETAHVQQVWHDRRAHWRGHRFHRHRDRFDWGAAAVGGLLGFGLGAALTAPRTQTWAHAPRAHPHVHEFAHGGIVHATPPRGPFIGSPHYPGTADPFGD